LGTAPGQSVRRPAAGMEGGRLLRRVACSALVFIGFISPPSPSPAGETEGVAIVVHAENPAVFDPREIRSVFLGTKTFWTALGEPVRVILQPRSAPASRRFFRIFFDDEGRRMSRAWVRNIITGSARAPGAARDDLDVMRRVAALRGAIGYVRREAVSEGRVKGVRVLKVLVRGEGP